MIKVGLIGCGFMGNMHANCYKNIDGVKLVAVADLRREKAEEIADGATIYSDGIDLINNAENGAIMHLLRELGFESKSYFGRFLKGETDIPVRRHRVVVTECDGKRYVIEVGIGIEAPRVPLLLEEGIEQKCGNASFCFTKDAFLGWVLNEKINGEYKPYYAFTEEEQLDIDYIQPSFYCEKHPESPFNKSPMVAIKTPNGRRAVNDHDYKVFEGDALIHIEENVTDARLYEILKTDFGIEWQFEK